MCVTVDEATAMIEAAQNAGKMLSVFHNRRQDDFFKTLRRLLVEEKLIGDIFSVEIFSGGWSEQNPNWWRSVKAVSGGYFYDWGAHFLDWMLGVIPGKMTDISGYFHKRVWHDVTNEDQVQAIVRFDSGCVANITMSSIAHAGKPSWWVLGEKGALVARNEGGRQFYEVTGDFEANGYRATLKVPFTGQSEWQAYYANIAGHLLRGEELEVKPEQARRIIAVLEGAEKASRAGHSLSLPTEEHDAGFQRRF
jgi:scyllo-inositol 2-dehydrogenase (NADP+)